MFWFIFVGVFAFFAVISFAMEGYLNTKGRSDGGWAFIGGIMVFLAMVCFVVGFGTSLYARSDQIENIENVRMYTAKAAVLEKKANELTTQFAGYLAETYPQFERDIFKQIAPDKVSLYMAKYPELKSSATLTTLVEQISKLQSDRYDQELKKQEVLKDLRFMPKNPWVIRSWIPPAPDEP